MTNVFYSKIDQNQLETLQTSTIDNNFTEIQGSFPSRSTEMLNSELSIQMTGFIENKGQLKNPEILYYFNSGSFRIGFGSSQIYFQMLSADSENIGLTRNFGFSLSFPGSAGVMPSGDQKLGHTTNFFIGQESIQNVPSYAEVRYHELYPNIDLRYYFTVDGLKYDFIVRAGGNPNDITISPSSAVDFSTNQDKTSFYEKGSTTPILTDDSLLVYSSNGNRVEASFKTVLKEFRSYQFEIGEYDPSFDLIIDPIWMYYSSFIGGYGTDISRSVVVDDQGQAIIIGYTSSGIDFPVLNGYDETYDNNGDVFVVKMNATGNGLVFTTFIGASANDYGYASAIDIQNNIYITGYTASYNTNYPTVNAYDDTLNGGNDIFISKLNSTGNGLVFSTYFGGSGSDVAYGIKVDTLGNSYITGSTTSNQTAFPLINSYNATFGGSSDVFVAKFNATGNGLIYSTYVGSSGGESANGIEIDTNGNAFITGFTSSPSFPLFKAFDSTFSSSEAFVLGLNPSGNGLLFSSFIGGSADDYGYAIDLDGSGNIYISGDTTSTQGSFPLINPYDGTFGAGVYDAFVMKINSTGTGIVYSTYIGGSQADHSYGIVVDSSNNVFVTGHTRSDESTFPISNAFDGTHNGGLFGDIFVVKINPTGDGLVYSSFLGGTDDDIGRGIVLDQMGDVYITGETKSADFPTKNAYDDTIWTGTDTFITKLSGIVDNAAPVVDILTPMNNTDYYTSSVEVTYSIAEVSPYSVEISLDGTQLGNLPSTHVFSGLTQGLHNVTVKVTDSVGYVSSKAHNFTIDLNGPSITILFPSAEFIASSTPNVLFHISNQSNLVIDWYINNVLTSPISNGTELSLEEGINNITVVVTDQETRIVSQQRIVTVDTTSPVISHSEPSSTYYSSTLIPLQYTITETNIATTTIYIDGAANTTELVTGSMLNLAEGNHNITIYTIDKVGNVGLEQIIFVIDTTTPSVTISSPGSQVNSFSVILDYAIIDTSPIVSVKVYIDNVANSSNLEPGVIISSLAQGQHNITVVVIDAANNFGIATIIFSISITTSIGSTNIPTTSSSTSTTISSPTQPTTLSQTSSSTNPTDTSDTIASTNEPSPLVSAMFVLTFVGFIITRRREDHR